MKKIFAIIAALTILPTVAFATPTSWDYTPDILKPLISQINARIFGSSFHGTSTATSSTFAVLNNVRYADQFPGSDIGAKVNAAYANLGADGGEIVISASSTFTTTMNIGTYGKPALIRCLPGVILTYVGSATSTRFDTNNVAPRYPANAGMQDCYLKGPFESSTTTTGIDLGGNNGAANYTFTNTVVSGFGTGYNYGKNTYLVEVVGGSIIYNWRAVNINSANNSGENLTFTGTLIADCLGSSAEKCFFADSDATASLTFTGVSFDDAQLYLEQGNYGTTITGGHFENPATAFANYSYIVIEPGAYTNMTITGTTFWNGATSSARTPNPFILNGGYLTLNNVTVAAGSGISSPAFVQNIGSEAYLNVFGFNETGTSIDTISTSTSIGFNTADNQNVGVGVIPTSRFHVRYPTTVAPSLTWDSLATANFRSENSELVMGLSSITPFPLYLQGRTSSNAARALAINPIGGAVIIGSSTPTFGSIFTVFGTTSLATTTASRLSISGISDGCLYTSSNIVTSTGLPCASSGGGGSTTTINGVQGNTFTFATGTTGTNFNIATSSGTLTFNLPTASAANRGLLSTTDWSAFNAAAASTTALTPTYIRGLFSASSPITYNSGTGAFTLSTAGDWTGTFDGQEGSYYLNRANHTGTQLASTISDFTSTASSAATGATLGGDLTGTVSNAQIGIGAIVNADISGSAAIALSKLAVDPLARANHTGTQSSTTITGLGTLAGLSSVNLTSNVTGILPTANGGTGTSTSAIVDFYTTPSNRITAGANCSWAGNTFNCTGGSSSTSTNLFATTTGKTYLLDALSALQIGTTTGTTSNSILNPSGQLTLIGALNRLAFSKGTDTTGNIYMGSSIASNTVLTMLSTQGTADPIEFDFSGATVPQIAATGGQINIQGLQMTPNLLAFEGLSSGSLEFSTNTASTTYIASYAPTGRIGMGYGSTTEEIIFDFNTSNTLTLGSPSGINLISFPSATYRTGNFESSNVSSASSPAFRFSADTNTGIYKTFSGDANSLSFTTNGVHRATINDTDFLIGSSTSAQALTVYGSTTLASTTATTFSGAGLSDCDNPTTSKLLWDITTLKFTCGTDQSGGGGGSGSNWTIVSGGLRTSTTTDFAQASYLRASSTSATSTFAGNVAITGRTTIGTPSITPNIPLLIETNEPSNGYSSVALKNTANDGRSQMTFSAGSQDYYAGFIGMSGSTVTNYANTMEIGCGFSGCGMNFWSDAALQSRLGTNGNWGLGTTTDLNAKVTIQGSSTIKPVTILNSATNTAFTVSTSGLAVFGTSTPAEENGKQSIVTFQGNTGDDAYTTFKNTAAGKSMAMRIRAASNFVHFDIISSGAAWLVGQFGGTNFAIRDDTTGVEVFSIVQGLTSKIIDVASTRIVSIFGSLAVSDYISLSSTTTPPVPAPGTLNVFKREIGGRNFLATQGPSGLDTALQPLLARNKVGYWNPPGNANTVPGVFGFTAPTVTGFTATARNVATTNHFTRYRRLGYVTAATAGAVGQWRVAVYQHTIGDGAGVGGFTYITRFGVSDAATVSGARMFFGMKSSATPTNVEPNTLTNAIGMCSGAADTNFKICYGGSSAQTPIDLGANFPANTLSTDMYELVLFASPASTDINFEVTRLNTGDTATGTISGTNTQRPSPTTLLAPWGYRTNNATALAVGLDVASAYIETDY